jgi:hypothetical protein
VTTTPLRALIEYWKTEAENWNAPPYVSRDDWETIRSSKTKHEVFRNFKEYASSDSFYSNDTVFHTGLLPVPYVGDLQNAQVVVCMLNPGFGPSDYFAEEQDDFREATMSNLMQCFDHDRIPFFLLDRTFAWSGGYTWWWRKFKPVIEAMKQSDENRNMTTEKAIELIGRKVAAIELIPYHSVKSPLSPTQIRDLESAKRAVEAVSSLRERGTLIVVTRSASLWGFQPCGLLNQDTDQYIHEGNAVVYDSRFAQSASLKRVSYEIAMRVMGKAVPQ